MINHDKNHWLLIIYILLWIITSYTYAIGTWITQVYVLVINLVTIEFSRNWIDNPFYKRLLHLSTIITKY